MKLTPERLEILKEQARKNIPASFLAAGVLDLIANLEEVQMELENERARGIHSCHDNCTQDGCVNRRLRDELAATRKQLEDSKKQIISWREEWQRENDELDDTHKKLAEAQSSEAHWRANHDSIVRKLRLFTQRDDLPVDRLPAYGYVLELENQLAEAQAKLAHLAECWNRDENEIAMKDACWHTVEVAEASGTSALDAVIASAITEGRAKRLEALREWIAATGAISTEGSWYSELESIVAGGTGVATAPHDLPSEQSYLDSGGYLRLEKQND